MEEIPNPTKEEVQAALDLLIQTFHDSGMNKQTSALAMTILLKELEKEGLFIKIIDDGEEEITVTDVPETIN